MRKANHRLAINHLKKSDPVMARRWFALRIVVRSS